MGKTRGAGRAVPVPWVLVIAAGDRGSRGTTALPLPAARFFAVAGFAGVALFLGNAAPQRLLQRTY